MEGVGGTLRQCVYLLKYRHLLLRNSVFWGGGWELCLCVVCVRVVGEHTQKWKEAVVTKLIWLVELHIHWTMVELKCVNHA